MKNILNEFGDYSGQVVIELPDTKEKIYCDYELASEVAYLHMIGIKTLAACSGHKKHMPTIDVLPAYTNDMIKLGYIQIFTTRETGATFVAKTNLDIFEEVE